MVLEWPRVVFTSFVSEALWPTVFYLALEWSWAGFTRLWNGLGGCFYLVWGWPWAAFQLDVGLLVKCFKWFWNGVGSVFLGFDIGAS